MDITLHIPDTMTARVRKVAVQRTMTSLPQIALQAIFAYGFQRINNDAGAVGKNESDDAAVAKSDKRWNSLAAGILRASPIREGDPVRAAAVKIATAKVNAAAKAKGLKPTAADVRKMALALIEKDESIMAVAKSNVAAVAGLDTEVDLDDLGFDPESDEPTDD